MTHMRSPEASLGRRGLLQSAGALIVAATIVPATRAAQAADAPPPVAPNVFVRVADDNTVTVICKHLEMGQGNHSGLARIVAEEIDADWSQIRTVHAPADAKLYANHAFGMQGTGGSSAINNSYDELRKAGAQAKAMLVQAAAQAWRVPAAELTVSKGVLSHANGKHGTFGEFAVAASKLPVPTDVRLKDAKDFVLIGHPDGRVDTPAKTDGSAQYAIDVRLPGLLTAVIARPPRFGGTVKSFDAKEALAIRGVKGVHAVPTGVAVVAEGYWPALRGRDALRVEWDEAKAEKRSTADLNAEYRALLDKPGKSAKTAGDSAAALKGAAKTITADYEVPYLAHAPMEPLDCVLRRNDAGVELWYGCQFQTVDQANVARILGFKPEQVTINTIFAGGSFGRRATFTSDFVGETAEVAKHLPTGTPVRLIWSREDDIRGGRYRPMYHHRLTAGLDANGKLVAWQHRIVGQSIMAGTPFESKDGIDTTSVEGASNLPYQVANLNVELQTTQNGVPILWWRSVGSSHTAFAIESFIDRIAKEGGQDPLAFRRSLLPADSKFRKVLDLAAEKADWSKALPAGHARGIAIAESFATTVAQVVEISRGKDGAIKIERVVCALDCGTAINPNSIAAQMEGGIAFGLGAALKGAITLAEGKVEQSNFDTYDVLRMSEMPPVEVHILPSTEKPTGTGEPGVPPIAPALANAIFALTGKPVTVLPLNRAVAV